MDSDLVLHVVKAFTEHIRAPKEGWVKYEPQPKPKKENEVKATLASLEPIDEIPFPNTVQKHIIEYEQVKGAQQKEEEESVPVVKEIMKETKDEEVTKEAIMAMYAHCNIVELDTEASVLVEGKVKARDVGKPILPCIFKEISHYGLCDLDTAN